MRKSIDVVWILKERFREECSPRLLAVVVVIPSSVFVTAVVADFLFAVDVGGGVWPLRHCSSYFTLFFSSGDWWRCSWIFLCVLSIDLLFVVV